MVVKSVVVVVVFVVVLGSGGGGVSGLERCDGVRNAFLARGIHFKEHVPREPVSSKENDKLNSLSYFFVYLRTFLARLVRVVLHFALRLF